MLEIRGDLSQTVKKRRKKRCIPRTETKKHSCAQMDKKSEIFPTKRKKMKRKAMTFATQLDLILCFSRRNINILFSLETISLKLLAISVFAGIFILIGHYLAFKETSLWYCFSLSLQHTNLLQHHYLCYSQNKIWCKASVSRCLVQKTELQRHQ